MWIFAYGSVVWRPGFTFLAQTPATLSGWHRRFWQRSLDHRGTPESPGRVLTLVPEEGAFCEGMAFQIDDQLKPEILRYLDHREKGGYDRTLVTVTLKAGDQVEALTYIAHPQNPNYAGPTTDEDIVAIIRESTGPSGPNDEYLIELHKALANVGITDSHVVALANLLKIQA